MGLYAMPDGKLWFSGSLPPPTQPPTWRQRSLHKPIRSLRSRRGAKTQRLVRLQMRLGIGPYGQRLVMHGQALRFTANTGKGASGHVVTWTAPKQAAQGDRQEAVRIFKA